MRILTDHIVEDDRLKITVLDEPGQGNASHEYEITGPNELKERISFQNGPIKEFGVNGITQEALLAIVIDRLRFFRLVPFLVVKMP